MENLRNVNNDILKDCFNFRDENISSLMCVEDRKHQICFDEISNNILRNVPKQNQKYVKKQLNLLDDNLFDYICYWNEKYYKNGFCDGIELLSSTLSK